MYIIQLEQGEYDDYKTIVLGFTVSETEAIKISEYYDKRFRYLQDLSEKFNEYVFNELQQLYPRPTVDWSNKLQYKTEWKTWTRDFIITKNKWWNKNLDKPLDEIEKKIACIEQKLMTGFHNLYDARVWYKKIELIQI